MVLAAAGGIGAGGYFWWQNNRVQEWRTRADAEYAKGNWNLARGFYGRYLSKKRDDLDALKRYADASSKIPEKRQSMLGASAQAYQQYLYFSPHAPDAQNALLAIYDKIPSWPDLEHYSEQFLLDRPDDAMLLYYRAKAKAHGGNQDDAIAAYRDLIGKGSAPAKAYDELAALLQAKGLPNEAEQTVVDAVKAHPDDVQVQLAAMRYYASVPSPAGVRRHLDEALRLAPNNPSVLYEGARAAFQEGEYSNAIERAEKCLTVDPKNTEAAILLGHAYALRENTPKAIEALQKLDRLARADNPEAVVLLADLLYSQTRIDEAKPLVAEYVDSYPNQAPIADYFKGRELLAQGKFADAADVLDTVAEKLPNFPPAQFFLAYAYIESEQRELGRTTLETYVRQNPGDKKASALLAREFGPPMSVQEAQQSASGLLANDNASAVDLVNAARQVAQSAGGPPSKEDLEVLKQLLNEALRRDPKLALGYRALADMQISTGDLDGAQQTLDRAKAAGVPEAEFFRTEARLALSRKDVEGAKGHLDAAFAAETVTLRDVQDWAEFFAGSQQRDLSEYALSKGREKLGAGAEAALAVERATIASRFDTPDSALATLNDAATKAAGKDELSASLNAARLEVARRFLLESGPAEDNRKKAGELIATARKQDPRDPTAMALEAQMLLKKEPPDIPGARALLQTVLDTDGKNVIALLGLAEIEYHQGNSLTALRYAEQAASIAPRSVPVGLLRAQLYMDLNRHLEAQAALDGVLSQDTGNIQALRMAVESCIASDRIPQAEERLKRLEDVAANDPSQAQVVQSLRGKLYAANGRGGEGESVLRAQYEANKDDLDALRNLATTLASLKRLPEAEALYQEYTERHKDSTQAWVDLARLRTMQDDPDAASRASEALTRALLIDPNNVQAIRQMIQVQLRRGNLLEALNWCNRYLDREPDNPEVLYQKAVLLRQRGELPEAVKSIDRAIGMADQAEYKALRGLIYVDLKDYAKALQDLQEVASGPSGSTAQVDLALAESYLATGRNELARQYYESAQRKVTNEQQPVDPQRMKAIGDRVKGLEGTT
jgi:tetratricopeptide (TPR) repeat protein